MPKVHRGCSFAWWPLPSCLLLLAGLGFVVFLLRDPDKLQSEDYQIRKRTLEMIGEKGGNGRLVELVEAAAGRLTNKDDHD